MPQINEDAFKASPVSNVEFQHFLDTIQEGSSTAAASSSPRRTTRAATRMGAASPPATVAPPLKRGRKKQARAAAPPQASSTPPIPLPPAQSPALAATPAVVRSLTEDLNDYLGGTEGVEAIAAALSDRELLTPVISPRKVEGLVAAILPAATVTSSVSRSQGMSKRFPPVQGKFSPPPPLLSHVKSPRQEGEAPAPLSITAVSASTPTSTRSADSTPPGSPTPQSKRIDSPSPQLKQHIGRPPDRDRTALEGLFDSMNTAFQGLGEALGVPENDIRVLFEKWCLGKDASQLPGCTDDGHACLLERFEVVKKDVMSTAATTSNTIATIIKKYHTKHIATTRAPNAFNQYEALNKVVRSHKQLDKLDPVSASQDYVKDKERGVLGDKLAIYSSLKTVEGGNLSFQSREKMFQAHVQTLDRLVTNGERQHLQTLAFSVGTSIHQDQSIVHLKASPLMEQFVNDVLKITTDELLGLARAYACYHVENVQSLGSHAAANVQAATQKYPLPPDMTSEKKSPLKPQPAIGKPGAASSSKVKLIDPLPLTIQTGPIGTNLHKPMMINYLNAVIDSLCTKVCEHSDTVADEGNESKRRWSRLPAFLAKAGLYVTNYPVRGVIPGLADRGQGIRGLTADELKTLALSISVEGGELQLHCGNATELCNFSAPVIITAPPRLTVEEKVLADQGKQATSQPPAWPFPAGVRFFADGHWDFNGPPAIVKDTAIVVPDDDDEDESDVFVEPTRGHKRSGSVNPGTNGPAKKPKPNNLLPPPSQPGPKAKPTPMPKPSPLLSATTQSMGVVPDLRVEQEASGSSTISPTVTPAPTALSAITLSAPKATATSSAATTSTTSSSAPSSTTTPAPSAPPSTSAATNIAPASSNATLSQANTHTSTTSTGNLDANYDFMNTILKRAPTSLLPVSSGPSHPPSYPSGSTAAFQGTPALLRQASCDAQSPFHQGGNLPQPASNDVLGLFQAFVQHQQQSAGAAMQPTPATDQSALIAQLQQQLQQQAQQLGAYQVDS
ncbi:hypothetical protein BKA70DRAFT_1466315 [Coprinopsis sp. MPI-PUGE-AT-0042]|nr:hypothetical protein BKA70DRAFT_1466315 [Coprinopsis sp. MPI-PUGE-AT-0042]